MDKATQRAIMAADAARRDARDIADFIALIGAPQKPKDHAMLVRADARAIGAVTALGAPQRTPPRETCNEVITDAAGTPIHIPGAVKVTKDGVTTYHPASHFRKTRESKQRQRKNQPIVINETSRVTLDPRDIQALADGTA